nr:isoflavone 2'-hydroxylase-like [Tanacetum cinerariifolium]
MVEANFYNLILLIFTLLLIIFKLFPNRTLNLPPSPPSLPIIGHLHLLTQPVHEKLYTLSRKLGPIMLLRFGLRKVIIVSCSSVVEECFTKSNDIVLANRPQMPSPKHLHYNFISMSTAPYGHLWRSLRRFASTELFSTTRLNSTSHSREHEVKLMCKQILKESSQKVELKSWFFNLFCNVLTMSMMGKRYCGDIIDTGGSRFQEMMAELFRLVHSPYLGDFVPILAWIDFGGLQKEMVGLMKKIDLILNEVIEERRRVGSYESGIMLDKLLALQEQEPELYTDEVIRAHIVVINYFLFHLVACLVGAK